MSYQETAERFDKDFKFTLADVDYRLRRAVGIVVSDKDAQLILDRIDIDYPFEGECWPNIDVCYMSLSSENKLYRKMYTDEKGVLKWRS